MDKAGNDVDGPVVGLRRSGKPHLPSELRRPDPDSQQPAGDAVVPASETVDGEIRRHDHACRGRLCQRGSQREQGQTSHDFELMKSAQFNCKKPSKFKKSEKYSEPVRDHGDYRACLGMRLTRHDSTPPPAASEPLSGAAPARRAEECAPVTQRNWQNEQNEASKSGLVWHALRACSLVSWATASELDGPCPCPGEMWDTLPTRRCKNAPF